MDFNASFVNLQNQIDDMKKTTDESMQTMANLKRQLNQRDFIIDDQNSRISSLRDTLERNETYSRRDNLIFGGISQPQMVRVQRLFITSLKINYT